MSVTVAAMSDDDPRSGRPDGSEAPPAGSSGPPGTFGEAGTADPVDAAGAVGDYYADLVGAVNALETVSTAPVHTRAARYHEVHTLLQDALSATDHPGP